MTDKAPTPAEILARYLAKENFQYKSEHGVFFAEIPNMGRIGYSGPEAIRLVKQLAELGAEATSHELPDDYRMVVVRALPPRLAQEDVLPVFTAICEEQRQMLANAVASSPRKVA